MIDDEPISTPLSRVRAESRLLLRAEDRVMDKVMRGVFPTPDNRLRIVELNRSEQQPEVNSTELEAGADQCVAG